MICIIEIGIGPTTNFNVVSYVHKKLSKVHFLYSIYKVPGAAYTNVDP